MSSSDRFLFKQGKIKHIVLNSVAFCSPAKSLTFGGLIENPFVGKKLKSEHPSKMHQSKHMEEERRAPRISAKGSHEPKGREPCAKHVRPIGFSSQGRSNIERNSSFRPWKWLLAFSKRHAKNSE